jgi:hypothetical protein
MGFHLATPCKLSHLVCLMHSNEWLTETAMEICLDIILTAHDTSASGVMLEVPLLGRACYDAALPDFHRRVSGYLEKVGRSFHDSPSPIDKLCFPYGDGMHWWCICLSFSDQKILFGDGLSLNLPRHLRPGMNKVFSEHLGIDISSWTEIRIPIRRQMDSSSCGLVALALIECVCAGHGFDNMDWSPEDPDQHRKMWLTRAIELHQKTTASSQYERSRIEQMQERDVAPPDKSANCRNMRKNLRKPQILHLHHQLNRLSSRSSQKKPTIATLMMRTTTATRLMVSQTQISAQTITLKIYFNLKEVTLQPLVPKSAKFEQSLMPQYLANTIPFRTIQPP